MSFLSPYRAVLCTPYARAAFAASLAGRLCYGIVSLSLILTLTAGGRNYRFAGFVMALFGLSVVLASPARAWMVDRHGPRRALPPMAAGFAVALMAVAVVPAGSGAGDAAIAVLAVAAGTAPPVARAEPPAVLGRQVSQGLPGSGRRGARHRTRDRRSCARDWSDRAVPGRARAGRRGIRPGAA